MKSNEKGFLILEILIAGLILTSSIAATMYLFRLGYEHLERANDSNVISARLPQVLTILKTVDLNAREGSEDMGGDVVLNWNARRIRESRPFIQTPEAGAVPGRYELYLYKVDLKLNYKNITREYEVNVFRYGTPGLS